jgi:serine/threonine protein kinase
MSAPRDIGRYTLFGEIAAGGMATVHLGRLAGAAGFARTVAIKQLHPHYASDPGFVRMFEDEARLAARIHHPNVVQTLDVVAEKGELFLVLDYVQGETLSRIWRSLREQEELAPASVTASILTGVLHGLHAAHEAKDDDGKPLNIVHRDVSPQNVMVGVDGVARLLDFGVAKAAVRATTTQEGELKGKLAYMAPESLEHHEVTRLSDLYAVGVLLWEGLTGRRLFEAETEGQLLRRILLHPIETPGSLIQGVPPELDAITMRAIDRDPQKRFQTAREMALAIERVTEIARASQVSEWIARVAKKPLEARAERVAELLGKSAAPSSSRISGESSAVRPLERERERERTPITKTGSRRELTPTPGTPPSFSKTRMKKRVLAIDDSEVILSKIKRALEEDGVEVITTTRTVGNARYLVDCDLVIIDYHMPGLDGGSVIRSLRSAASASNHPVLFYLYTQDPTIARDYAKLGFDGCLTEKGDEKELVRQVRSAFRVLQMRALRK